MTALEAAALLVVCAVYFGRGLVGAPGDRATALTGAAMGIAFAVLLAVLARGVASLRRAALTPVILTQLLALPVGWSFLRAEQYVAGVAVLGPALAVFALLLGNRPARDAFR